MPEIHSPPAQESTTANSNSTIRIEYKKHRSTPNAVIQKIISTFSSTILKPGNPLPFGSPKLVPHKSAFRRCRIEELHFEESWIYRFSESDIPEDKKGASQRHRLYYFSGGGFRGAPTKEHWLFCAELCKCLPDYEVHLVSYPLAPNSPASISIPHLERLFASLAKDALRNHSRITLMGDSAGGNIALVLGLYLASDYLHSGGSGRCPLEAIFLISPAVDHRNNNSEIDKREPYDCILSRKTIEEVSDNWKGDWLVEDPRISPTLADLTILKRAGIKVDGVLGTYDVLAPDATLFRNKLASIGVDGNWLEWEKQMHCFPILCHYHIHEAVEAKEWIVRILNQNAKAAEL